MKTTPSPQDYVSGLVVTDFNSLISNSILNKVKSKLLVIKKQELLEKTLKLAKQKAIQTRPAVISKIL